MNKFKELLEKEKDQLVSELEKVGRINPDNPLDWEPTPTPMTEQSADENEMADRIEEYEERTAVEVQLEERLNNVLAALKKIKDGTYGTCDSGEKSHPIEEKRLLANPAARTCIAHMNE